MGVIVQLKILNEVPSKLYTCKVTEVHEVLGGPTIIHLKGKLTKPIFLSALLHGNETTSFDVLSQVLNKYKNEELPRDLIIFIGNTLAAVEGMRHLPGQPDYNRIWQIGEGDTPEHEMAAKVTAYVKEHKPFASIDIHNNTGKNPLYGCVNSTEPEFMALASHFGSNTVYFTEPHNVQSMGFCTFCTAITIEAGLPSEPRGVVAAFEFFDKIFHMDKITMNPERSEFEIYHTIARLKVDERARIDFEDQGDGDSDLSFIPEFDSQNFKVVKKQTHLGHAKNLKCIRVEDNNGRDLTNDFFKIEGSALVTNRTFIPSMFTKDIYVMKEDCLGYIMEVIIPTK